MKKVGFLLFTLFMGIATAQNLGSGVSSGWKHWDTVAKLPVGGDTLTIKQLRNFRFDKQLSISRSGSHPWKHELDGNPDDWRIDGDTLLIEATDSWEMWFHKSYGLDIRSGKLLWDIVGIRRYADKNFVVVQRVSTITSVPDLRTFNLAIFDRRTQKLSARKFILPERPACGKPDDYLDDAEYARSRFDAHYLYAHRKDACGVFTARFDWQGTDRQLPVINPK